MLRSPMATDELDYARMDRLGQTLRSWAEGAALLGVVDLADRPRSLSATRVSARVDCGAGDFAAHHTADDPATFVGRSPPPEYSIGRGTPMC